MTQEYVKGLQLDALHQSLKHVNEGKCHVEVDTIKLMAIPL